MGTQTPKSITITNHYAESKEKQLEALRYVLSLSDRKKSVEKEQGFNND